jgi:hypothetical protein
VCRLALPLLALLAAGCASEFDGGGELRARKVALKREVIGLRQMAAALERGESALPPGDVAIAVDDGLVRELIAAQLPFELDVQSFHVSLRNAEVHFRGSPTVRLRGTARMKAHPGYEAALTALGALDEIRIDRANGRLNAAIAVDHIGIDEVAGLESLTSPATLDELARAVRLRLKEQLPPIQIPIKVSQQLDLPALTTGPVRLDGARMPLEVAVSRVIAAQGQLWIALSVRPGELVKTADAPEAGDTRPGDVGPLALGSPGAEGGGEGGRR